METTKYRIIWSQNVHFVTTLLLPLNKKTYLTKVVKEYALMKEMSRRPQNMEYVHLGITLTDSSTGMEVLYPRMRDF